MKKLFLTALAITSLLSASFAFANTNGYFSKQHPLSKNELVAAKKNLTVAPTDIVINNATNYPIYVEVPAGGFTDKIYPRGFDHIMNWQGSFATQLIIKAPNGMPINGFSGSTYCPHAVITVYGYQYSDIVVDNKSC